MAEIIEFPDNVIGIEDHKTLESFGGHEVEHRRATRFHWSKDKNGDPVFELFKGTSKDKLTMTIKRDREKDEFQAFDKDGTLIVTGSLSHVMTVLDKRLNRLSGEISDGGDGGDYA